MRYSDIILGQRSNIAEDEGVCMEEESGHIIQKEVTGNYAARILESDGIPSI